MSELEPRLAGRVGDCLDAAVVEEAVAVEHHLFDLLLARELGDRAPDALGALDVAGRREVGHDLLRARRDRGQGAAGAGVGELRVHVAGAPIDREPRVVGALDRTPHPLAAPEAPRPLRIPDLSLHRMPQAVPALPTLRRTCSPT